MLAVRDQPFSSLREPVPSEPPEPALSGANGVATREASRLAVHGDLQLAQLDAKLRGAHDHQAGDARRHRGAKQPAREKTRGEVLTRLGRILIQNQTPAIYKWLNPPKHKSLIDLGQYKGNGTDHHIHEHVQLSPHSHQAQLQ